MPYGLYVSAEGASAQNRRMEALANNLANVDTVGFKRELAVFQARYSEATQRGQDEPGSGSINDMSGGVYLKQTDTDFSSGPLKRTTNPTDMAIDGEGFFVVQKGDTTYLTRAGNFRLNVRGELVTQQDHAVLNDTGSPIVIDPSNGPWMLTPQGTIRQPGAEQTLALVKAVSRGDLAKCGENLFRPLAETRPVAPEQRRVVSGYLEGSGVQPTTEMVELIETTRAIEVNVAMMQTQDEMSGNLLSRLLRNQQ